MDETGEEGWARYRKLKGAGGLISKKSEPYVRFSVKFPHLRRRPLTGRQRIFNHRTRIIPAAAHQPLSTGGSNAQGVVDQISNGVSVLNLGQGHVANPNPAAAATSSSSSSSGNNNY